MAKRFFRTGDSKFVEMMNRNEELFYFTIGNAKYHSYNIGIKHINIINGNIFIKCTSRNN